MRFNCGPTLAERLTSREKRLSDWHGWFAWHPVRIENNRCAWLELVMRKGRRVHSWHEAWWDFEYRTVPR